MLAEELQGHDKQSKSKSKAGTSYMPRMVPSSGLPKAPSFRAPIPENKQMTSSRPFGSGKNSVQEPSKSASSVASTGHTPGIQCHYCQGYGHVQKNCPSQWAYIAIEDGYISATDVEDDDEEEPVQGDDEVFGCKATAAYRSVIVQRVLSAQVQPPEKIQRHNLFQIFFVINDWRARVIIDGGSCNNLVSSDLVKKLGLTTRPHPHPYHIQWLNDSGKAKVTKTYRVSFSIGTYADFVDCDVVPMEACSLLLDRPWEFDNDAIHHGRSNTYTFVHKGKKITLVPMTAAEIVQADKERAASLYDVKSENQQVANSIYPPKKGKSTTNSMVEGIKLKGGVMLARKCDLAEISNDDICYTLVCKRALFSLDDDVSSRPLAVTNLLQEYENIFPAEIPQGLPPMRGIEHQIDLIPGATLPNRAAYRANPVPFL
jgi:hypothetical protein